MGSLRTVMASLVVRCSLNGLAPYVKKHVHRRRDSQSVGVGHEDNPTFEPECGFQVCLVALIARWQPKTPADSANAQPSESSVVMWNCLSD